MNNNLILNEINISHIPIINSWHHDTDSSYVEKLTEQFIDYVTSDPNYYSWVVYLSDILIGNVAYEIDEHIAYISIIINPDYRRQGYGKKILEQIKNRPEIRSIEKIIAGIKYTNEASRRFFESAGFIATEREVDDDGFIDYYFEIV